jgi:hypothetical protein
MAVHLILAGSEQNSLLKADDQATGFQLYVQTLRLQLALGVHKSSARVYLGAHWRRYRRWRRERNLSDPSLETLRRH